MRIAITRPEEDAGPLKAKLEAMGHKVGFVPPGMFKANAIEQVDGRWAGAADPRSEGAAVSE